jgi:DNA-binding transcriptional MocR family regulator
MRRAATRSIGPDKLNQLRHVRVLRDADGVAALMARHRELLMPKFAAVQQILGARLAGTGVARWSDPRGGYFVSLDVLDGCAGRVVELAKACGVAVTPAGRTFPYGRDPHDRNLRIAPSFPSAAEVRQATEVIAGCTILAASEQLLRSRGINE